MPHHRLVIIGSGPAGYTAALYAARAQLTPLVIAGTQPGGQLMGTNSVENWPGVKSIKGPELMHQIAEHAQSCGAQIVEKNVTAVDISTKPFTLTLNDNSTITSDSIIVACGATHRRLHCPGESEYWGKGVSVCATCDAPLYKDRRVVIVGGGNSAITYANQLARHGARITIMHILEQLTATDPTMEHVLNNPAIDIVYQHTVTQIHGDTKRVTGVTITSQKTGDNRELKTDGVFIAIGMGPNTDLFADQLERDTRGYLVCAPGTTHTSVPGIFAAGDVADSRYKQAITAAGHGCQAALDAEYFLTGKVMVIYN